MKNAKIITVAIAAAVLMLPVFDGVYARGGGGGGGHFSGGGHGGGGWSGGRSGSFEHSGNFERGGGEFQGRGDRPGEHGSGERRDGNHGRHDNNNNSNNTVNVYGNGGWGWGWGAADDALAGMMIGAAISSANSEPSTIIIEEPPANSSGQQAPANAMPQIGTQVTTIPPGAVSKNVNGIMAYECKGVWYRPYFGSSGVYYVVVSPPPENSISMDQTKQAK